MLSKKFVEKAEVYEESEPGGYQAKEVAEYEAARIDFDPDSLVDRLLPIKLIKNHLHAPRLHILKHFFELALLELIQEGFIVYSEFLKGPWLLRETDHGLPGFLIILIIEVQDKEVAKNPRADIAKFVLVPRFIGYFSVR